MVQNTILGKNTVQKASSLIFNRISDFRPKFGLILGSGLSDFIKEINVVFSIHSSEIPYYPQSTVYGHAGRLIFGYVAKDPSRTIPILIFQGRIHFYETNSVEQIVFPIYLAQRLGIKKLIVTNAAGGINSHFKAGDLMLITEILNLAFTPLPSNAPNSFRKPAEYFDLKMQHTILQCASRLNMNMHKGTYCWLKGPSYETTAEIQMLKRIGIDAVGMSTFPEIVAARNLGMKIAALSLISNITSVHSPTMLSHTAVIETAKKASKQFSKLMTNVIYSSIY